MQILHKCQKRKSYVIIWEEEKNSYTRNLDRMNDSIEHNRTSSF